MTNLFNLLTSNVRDKIDASKLTRKQVNSPESLHFWLYRYLSLRISLSIFVLYLLLLSQYDLIRCHIQQKWGNPKLVDLICLFTSSYVFRSDLIDKSVIEQQNRDRNSIFDSAFHPNVAGQIPDYLTYYLHVFGILLVLYLINLVSNIFYYQTKSFRYKWFNCTKSNCKQTNQFLCLLLNVNSLLNHQSKLHRVRFCLIYLLSDVVPLFCIGGSFCFLNYCFDGRFGDFGFKVWKYWILGQRDIVEPTEYLFPIVSNCYAHQLTQPSGEPVSLTGYCMLKLNFTNRYTFVFYWFWFALLFCLFGIAHAFKWAILLIPCFRTWYMNWTLNIRNANAIEKGEISFVQFVLLMNIKEFFPLKLARRMSIVFQEHWYSRDYSSTSSSINLSSSKID